MKKVYVFIIGVIITALFFSGCSPCCKSSFTKQELSKILESEWLKYKSGKNNFDGGLAMQILSPKGDYFISTGMGDITNAVHFRIASVTKTFTAAGIMLLEQRGLLKIDDKITDNIPGKNIPYLPDTPDYSIPYKKDITIKMLLMHRAGIFDVSNNAIPDNKFSHGKPYVGQNYEEYMMNVNGKEYNFTLDELVGVVAQNQLSFFVPGSAYHYSDTGYSMLGKIIERVSGKSYADFIKDELLVPNNLLETSLPYKGSDQTIPEPFVKGSVWVDNALQDVTKSNMSPQVAEGNITSTPIDLANWGKKLLTGQAGLTKETVEKMKLGMNRGDKTESTYGLGLVYSPESGYGHSGAHEGYLTLMSYNPKTDITYVMFTNTWDCQTCAKGLDSIMRELKFMSETSNKILKKMGY
ncbi:MAG: serine hydrolase [Candidatus Omnitrophica bacterium]|nr:serine hydrolase [Candidatus Omnitrophota bacterium]